MLAPHDTTALGVDPGEPRCCASSPPGPAAELAQDVHRTHEVFLTDGDRVELLGLSREGSAIVYGESASHGRQTIVCS